MYYMLENIKPQRSDNAQFAQDAMNTMTNQENHQDQTPLRTFQSNTRVTIPQEETTSFIEPNQDTFIDVDSDLGKQLIPDPVASNDNTEINFEQKDKYKTWKVISGSLLAVAASVGGVVLAGYLINKKLHADRSLVDSSFVPPKANPQNYDHLASVTENVATSLSFTPPTSAHPASIASTVSEDIANHLKDFSQLDNIGIKEELSTQISILDSIEYENLVDDLKELYEKRVRYLNIRHSSIARQALYANINDLIDNPVYYGKYDSELYHVEEKIQDTKYAFDPEIPTLQEIEQRMKILISIAEDQFLDIHNGFLDNKESGGDTALTELKSDFKDRYKNLLNEYILTPKLFEKKINRYKNYLQHAAKEVKDGHYKILDESYLMIQKTFTQFLERLHNQDKTDKELASKEFIISKITPYLQKLSITINKFSFFVEASYAKNMRIAEQEYIEAKITSSVDMLKEINLLSTLSDEQHEDISNIINELETCLESSQELFKDTNLNYYNAVYDETSYHETDEKIDEDLLKNKVEEIIDEAYQQPTLSKINKFLATNSLSFIKEHNKYLGKSKLTEGYHNNPIFSPTPKKFAGIEKIESLCKQATQIIELVIDDMAVDMETEVFSEDRLVPVLR